MKPGNNLLRFSVAFILGFVIAGALFAIRGREDSRNESTLYSEVAASLGKSVVMLSRLDSNDISGARFILETSLDGGLMTLHFRETEAPLDETQRKVFNLAKEYRRNHPFASTNYGVKRGEGVEELVERITHKKPSVKPSGSDRNN